MKLPMKHLKYLLWIALIAILPASALAQTMQQLLEEDRIRVSARAESNQIFVPGQQVKIIIELAVDTWFVGGTRFALPEVADAVVLRREKFATNLTRHEDGRDWTAQQFEITIYPQRAGEYTVVPLKLEVNVAGDRGARVVGTLMTPVVRFNVQMPEALEGDSAWIATSELDIEQSFDRSLEDLKPGDAVVRTIRMTAVDIPAMIFQGPQMVEYDGLGVYARTPVLMDRTDRGTYRAERTDVITYVIEASGQYVLPEQVFVWWNTRTGERIERTLPASTLDAGMAVEADLPEAPREPQASEHSRYIVMLAATAILVLLLWYLFVRNGVEARQAIKVTPPDWRKRYRTAVRSGDLTAAVSALYAWYDADAAAFSSELRPYFRGFRGEQDVQALIQLLRCVFSADQSASPAIRELERLAVAPQRIGAPGAAVPLDHDLR